MPASSAPAGPGWRRAWGHPPRVRSRASSFHGGAVAWRPAGRSAAPPRSPTPASPPHRGGRPPPGSRPAGGQGRPPARRAAPPAPGPVWVHRVVVVMPAVLDVGHRELVPMSPRAVDDQVDEDPVEPRPHRGAIAKLSPTRPGPQRRLLGQVLRHRPDRGPGGGQSREPRQLRLQGAAEVDRPGDEPPRGWVAMIGSSSSVRRSASARWPGWPRQRTGRRTGR